MHKLVGGACSKSLVSDKEAEVDSPTNNRGNSSHYFNFVFNICLCS